MGRRVSLRSGRGDTTSEALARQPLQNRDDDPSDPSGNLEPDKANPKDNNKDKDQNDKDKKPGPPDAAPTAAPSPVAGPSPPSSSARSIPTLTAIPHTPTFPSPTTLSRDPKTTSPSTPDPPLRTTATALADRPARVTASLAATTTAGTAQLASVSGQAGSTQPAQLLAPSLGRPSSPGMPPGVRAGIAIGVIGAVALLATLSFLLWKRRLPRRSTSRKPPQPEDGPPPNPRSQSAIMADLMASAYAAQNGGSMTDTYPNEKSPTEPQPQIRSSVASWLRRHHPLTLNPLSARSSTSFTGRATVSELSEATQQPQPAARTRYHPKMISVWSDSSTAFTTPVTPGEPGYPPVPPTPPSVRGRDKTRLLSVWSQSTSSRLSSAPSSQPRPDSSVRGTWLFPPPAGHQERTTPVDEV